MLRILRDSTKHWVLAAHLLDFLDGRNLNLLSLRVDDQRIERLEARREESLAGHRLPLHVLGPLLRNKKSTQYLAAYVNTKKQHFQKQIYSSWGMYPNIKSLTNEQ